MRSAAALETRSYVVSYFGQAAYSEEGDCPGGINPTIEEQYLKNLAALGYNGTEIEAFAKKAVEEGGNDIERLMYERGRIDGKPINPYVYPETVVDPKLVALTGKYAYGFDLDGRGVDDPDGFTDPETKEAGIDNQFFRAFGCVRPYRGSLAGRPTYWAWAWGQLQDSQPAWLITLSGEDLDKDGEVTVTFDRALEHLKSNSDGSPRHDVSYRIDSDPRSHNVFRGEIRDGVVNVTEHGNFRMLQNPLVAPELNLKSTHFRFKFRRDGSAEGILGGYQPWREIYFAFASGGPAFEVCITGDIVGLYYLLKRNADADANPTTGQNDDISASYQVEAVPAFAVPATDIQRKAAVGG